ncbi:LOW QUALITY PROTEIN: voltage-gated monoatomic cation channel TMEM109 [Ciconia maguari]
MADAGRPRRSGCGLLRFRWRVPGTRRRTARTCFRGRAAAADDPLSRLGRAAWEALEGWVGPQPLGLVAGGEASPATLWVVSSGISTALATLCGILGDLLAASGSGGAPLVRTAALSPGEVQRVLLWGLPPMVGCWLLSACRKLLLPALRWVKLCCFLGAFLHVAASRQPTAQAGMLLGLWVLYALLGRLVGSPRPQRPSWTRAVRSLVKVEELRRRQKWGGPRNREE